MPRSIDLDDLSVHYGSTTALDGIDLSFRPGAITALLGRNGSGKTTLLSTIAAYRRPTTGTVRIDGDDPYEDVALTSDIALVTAARKGDDGLSIKDVLDLAASLRPNWDEDLAGRLLHRFGIERTGTVSDLSTGFRSALTVTVGLAARTGVTLFDEAHLGMDASARYLFYDELLADYIEQPRTIVVSTHLIDEISNLVQDVVVLDAGRVLEHRPVDELRALGVELTGPAQVVDSLVAGARVLSERRLGRTMSAVVFGDIDDQLRRRAEEHGIDIGPLPLQDLVVHLTDSEALR